MIGGKLKWTIIKISFPLLTWRTLIRGIVRFPTNWEARTETNLQGLCFGSTKSLNLLSGQRTRYFFFFLQILKDASFSKFKQIMILFFLNEYQ